MSAKRNTVIIFLLMWAVVVLIARVVLDELKKIWPLILVAVLFFFVWWLAKPHPAPQHSSDSMEIYFDRNHEYQNLPSPSEEDQTVIPLENGKDEIPDSAIIKT